MSQKDETFNSKHVNYRIKSTDALEILMFHCIVIKWFANSFQYKLYTLKSTFLCNVLILQPVSRKQCHEFPLRYLFKSQQSAENISNNSAFGDFQK